MNPVLPYPFPVQKKKIDFYDIELAFVDVGEGDKTLLFVHGLGHSLLSWSHNIAELKDNFRCIAVDLPGYGLSSDSAACPYGMRFYAEVIAHFIEARKLKNVTIAGHSMGGQIAMWLALDFPQLLKSLVLCAPAGFEVFQPWEKAIFRNAMMFMDFVMDEEQSLKQVVQNSFYRFPESAKEYLENLIVFLRKKDKKRYRNILEQSINGMLNEPVFDRLNDIKCPVQILFGNHDGFIPNRLIHPETTKNIAENAVRKFPDARLKMLSSCGHFLQWEQSESVNALIKEFLS